MRRPGDDQDPKKRRKKVDLLGYVSGMWDKLYPRSTDRALEYRPHDMRRDPRNKR